MDIDNRTEKVMPDNTTENEQLEDGVINVGGKLIGSTVDLKDPIVPTENDYILVIRKLADGTKKYGRYTVDELIDALGKVATDAEEGAVEAQEAILVMKTAIESAIDTFNTKITQDNTNWDSKVTEDLQSLQTALTNALASIGESDTAGARGNAITSITNALNAALSSIGKTDNEGARKAALDAIQSALTAALSSIGQSDSEGARKAALDAISVALTNALDAIGESNAEGARGAAISAINQLYETIQTYIAQQNTVIDGKVTAATNAASAAETSATNAASSESAAATSASNASTSESNAATSETNAANSASTASTKAEEAASSATTASNAASTATTKAEEASTSATNAASSAADALDSKNAAAASETNAANSESLAEKWATNPEDALVDGSEYSSKHYAKKSEYWAGQAQAAVNIPDIYGYSETIGDGSTLEFTITHNMNTTTIIHDVWANTDDGVGFYSISTINANSLKITFEEAPAAGAITVNLLPVRLKNAN